MISRRDLLAATALTAASGVLMPGAAFAADPAMQSLSIFVPAAPGGGWDGLGRAMEQVLRTSGLAGSVSVENVGGAGGVVGLPRFIARRGKGDTLMVAGAVMVGAVLTNKSPIGLKNVVPIAKLTEEAGVIVVPASSPYKTLSELIAALKAEPGKVSVAGGSAGGIDHITLGLLLKAAGRQAKEGSYVAFAGGGPAQAAVVGAQVAAGISGWSEFAEQVKGGRLRALAVTGAARLSGVDVPTLRESGVDVVITNWRGVFGAPGISAAQRQALVDLVTRMHGLPAWKEIMTTRQWDDTFMTGDEFARFVEKDLHETETVLRELGLVT